MNLDERGSITLEAAVVFPFFLALLLLLVNLTHVVMVQITMDHAVDEAAKQIAAYSFPMTDMGGKMADLLNTGIGSDETKAVEIFFAGTGTLLGSFREYLRSGAEEVLEEAIKKAAEAEMKSHLPLVGMSSGVPFQMTDFKIYNPFMQNSPAGLSADGVHEKDIVIKVSYTVKITIPFSPLKEVHLKSSAAERAWVD